MIDIERVKLADTVTIDGLPNMGDKFPQLCLVVVRNHRTRHSPLRLAGHKYEATHASGHFVASTDGAFSSSGRASRDALERAAGTRTPDDDDPRR